MVNTITRTFSKAKRSLKQRIIETSLSAIDREVYAYIDRNPGLRLYQIDKGTMNSHHNWGGKHIVERLIKQGRVLRQSRPVGKQIIHRYYSL
tara:strand:+ start:450 stop:725 length:276 start_codon:yes stop_codon:yes gene_type:complete